MENCKQYPFLNIAPSFWDDNYNPDVSEDDYEIAHPSKKYCDWRNESRTKVKKYEDNHDKLNVNYEINATENIDAKNIDISIVLDSGRNPNTKAFEYDALLSTKYVPPLDYTYHTQHIDKADGTINKGIVRKGSVNVDVAKTESTIDLVVKYDGQTRIIRISR